ncbi:uncharacterized protein CLUP02_17487, partial [Colletotrichum lupini]
QLLLLPSVTAATIKPEPVSVPLHWDQHRPKVPTPNAVPQVTIPVYLGAFFFDGPRQPKNKARVLLRSHRARLRGNITGREHAVCDLPARCAFFYCSNMPGLEALGAASPADVLVHIPSSLSDETGGS